MPLLADQLSSTYACSAAHLLLSVAKGAGSQSLLQHRSRLIPVSRCSHETEKRHGAGKGNWGNEADDITACVFFSSFDLSVACACNVGLDSGAED